MGEKQKVVDMTSGSIMPMIIRFSVPLVCGSVCSQLYSIVDSYVSGNAIGDSATAAIGATYALYTLMTQFVYGFVVGFSQVVARAFGAHDREKIKRTTAGMIVFSLGISVLTAAVILALMNPIMSITNVPDSILADAKSYISILTAGLPVYTAYNMFMAVINSFGNSSLSLVTMITCSFMNIALDFLLVSSFKMGIAGIGLATVISQLVSAAVCGIYMFRNYRDFMPERKHLSFSSYTVNELMRDGIAVCAMFTIVEIGSVMYDSANNNLGDEMIAAHSLSRNVLNVFSSILGAIEKAGAVFVGQNFGAGNEKRTAEGIRKVNILEAAAGILTFVLILIAGRPLIELISGSSNQVIIDNAVLSLRIHFSMMAPLGIVLAMRAELQTMGYVTAPIICSVFELFFKMFASYWLIPTIGFIGTSITEPVVWLICSTGLMAYYAVVSKRKTAVRQ